MNKKDLALAIIGVLGLAIWVIAITVMFFPFLG